VLLVRFAVPAIVAVLFAAPSLAAQTVELSSRTFWLGEEPRTMEGYPPFFAPRRIGWIEEIVSADPILSDTVIHVELALRPASETVTEVRDYYGTLTNHRLDPRFDLPNYRILGSPSDPTRPLASLYYFPEDAGAGFKVSCGIDRELEELSLCLVLATYPPDDGIRLKVRLYFPDDPAERPGYFREVVERVRDLVYCLDVTEEWVDVRKERPTLTGCRPEETS